MKKSENFKDDWIPEEDQDGPPASKKSKESTSETNNVDQVCSITQPFNDQIGVKLFDDDFSHPVRNLRSRKKRATDCPERGINELDYYQGDEIPEHLLEQHCDEKVDVKVKPKAPSEFDRFDDLEELLSYPPHSDNIIRMEDYKCLDRRELLNNVILDFYLQYLHRELLSEEMRSRVHVCSTYFYSLYSTSANYTGWKDDKLRAEDKRYLRVKDLPCNKDVNIFEKDFVVFPCIDKEHWFLAIACYMRFNGAVSFDKNVPVEDTVRDKKNPEADPPIKKTCILMFDSVKGNGSRRTKAVKHLQNFFESEYKEKYQADFPLEKTSLIGSSVVCPQQSNATDCGLFVLEFCEQFLINAPFKDFRYPIPDMSDWFDTKVILKKREHIANIIKELIIKAKGALPDLPPISFSDDSEDVQIIEDSEPIDDNGNNNDEEFNNNNDFNVVNNNKVDETEAQLIEQQERDPLSLSQESVPTTESEISKFGSARQSDGSDIAENLNKLNRSFATDSTIKLSSSEESINSKENNLFQSSIELKYQEEVETSAREEKEAILIIEIDSD